MLRGFEAARGTTVVVAPCDAPLLRPALVQLLLDQLPGFEASVPQRRRFDPVRAVYERDAVLRELHRIGQPIESPSALVDRLRACFVDEEAMREADPRLVSFIDVNRASDFTRAERALRAEGDV